jgi:hypothetical protein
MFEVLFNSSSCIVFVSQYHDSHSSYPEGTPRLGIVSAIFQPGVIRSSALVQAKDIYDLIDEELSSAVRRGDIVYELRI